MGKKAKSMRSLLKQREKTKQKMAKMAAYAAMAGSSSKGKKVRSRTAQLGLRRRDDSCKNIGDIRHYPELTEQGVHRLGSNYRGRYKGLFPMRLF